MKIHAFVFGAAVSAAFLGSPLRAQDQAPAQDQASSQDTAAPGAAQAPGLTPGGTLGETYISVDASYLRFGDVADSPGGAGLGFDTNLPMSDHFDYTFAYDGGFSRAHDFSLTDNILENSVTTFYKFGHVSPFASAGFGYEWERVNSGITTLSIPDRFDRLDYDVNAGLEFPLSSAASLRAGIGDDDASIKSPRAHDWDYDLSANYWLGDVVGAFVGTEFRNGRGGALNAAQFVVGMRFLLSSN